MTHPETPMDKPDCDICRQPYHRHTEICGMGMVCPVAGVTYRAKRPDQSERVSRLEEALKEIVDESVFNQQRFAEDDDTDYFLRCFKAVKERARSALNQDSSNG